MKSKDTTPPIIVRGRVIRSDDNGLINLTDIWTAAGFSTNQKPGDWRRLPSSGKLITALLERIMGKSHNKSKIRVSSVYCGKIGANGGTYAHPILACAYAGYLSPKLEVEIREIWLRYRGGDASLADDILSRASPEANEWAATRALGRVTRTRYVSTLRQHGVEAPVDYAICTNETYLALFDGTAADLKRRKGLKKSNNLRDSMGSNDLAYLMAAEALSSERIDDTDCRGTSSCKEATRTSARYIREAIDQDRASRQRQIKMRV
jgi:hypothetical protein